MSKGKNKMTHESTVRNVSSTIPELLEQTTSSEDVALINEAIEEVVSSDDTSLNETSSDTPQEESSSSDMAAQIEKRKGIYDLLADSIMASDLPDKEKSERLSRVLKLRNKKVHLLITGATGSGKSSTINALFATEVAKVGVGVDPETESVEKYGLDNLTIWDTPGLGDGPSDEKNRDMILRKLSETDEEGHALIDLVLVVLDASSKDLGTSYALINDVIIPSLREDAESRILIGLNQADIAMKGAHWDDDANEPDEVLLDFLKKKASSVRSRIHEATGVDTKPVFYCAGYKEDGGEQRKPYNLTKLVYYIVNSIPKEKRLAIAGNLNPDTDSWLYDDGKTDYKEKTGRKFFETIGDCIFERATDGAANGTIAFGIPGGVIGFLIGGAWGAISGFFKALFSV